MAQLNNTEYVFVYGTLQSNYDNKYAVLLRSQATIITKAYCFGSVVQIDWYTGLLLNNSTNRVPGELYAIPPNSTILETLDIYENTAEGEYTRKKIDVFVENHMYKAWAYVYNQNGE